MEGFGRVQGFRRKDFSVAWILSRETAASDASQFCLVGVVEGVGRHLCGESDCRRVTVLGCISRV